MSQYGEPLHAEGSYICGRTPGCRPNGEGIVNVSEMGVGLRTLHMTPEVFASRAASCMTALAGIPDPAAFMAATADLKRELEECREVLRVCEWGYMQFNVKGEDYLGCPSCEAPASKGEHTPDCRLARLLEHKP